MKRKLFTALCIMFSLYGVWSCEINATLFSKTDLIMSGSGKLTVIANISDGIASKDGLIINDGTNTLFNLQSESGENIVTFKPSHSYQAVNISLPELKNGESYSIFTGGKVSGNEFNGVFSEETYSLGTKYADFTISSVNTII